MRKKSDLLKELGWNDQLIQHFMVEDSEFNENKERQLVAELFDSSSMILTSSAENSGTNFIVKGKSNSMFQTIPAKAK